MYSPTARLLAVLEILQSNKRISGAEIARRLEVNVRTVRRYITTLQDMGIPVEGERGPEGAYILQRGHRLPPLLYTEDEAVTLILGLIVLQAFQLPVDVVAVEAALAKTLRVVPEAVLRRMQSLRSAIVFNPGYFTQPPEIANSRFILALSSAVQERQSVHLRYSSAQGEVTERLFDPYSIVCNEGFWYAVGYCHLRNDMRVFRLDRIHEVRLSAESFVRIEDFDPLEHVLKAIALSPNTYHVELVLYTSLDVAQSVFSPLDGTFEETEEGVIFRRNVAELTWLAYLILHAPFRSRITQPVGLRDMLRELSAKALELSSEPQKAP